MAKKKRQGDPPGATSTTNAAAGDNSSESSDEFRGNSVECPHINKSIDLASLKKAIQRNGFSKECEQCKLCPKSSPLLQESVSDLYEFDESLWMCLRCGNQACGRGQSQHALQHYNTPHSDLHSLCLSTTNWSVWCYDCDNEVNISSKKKLLECVEYLKKHSDTYKQRMDSIIAASSRTQLIEVVNNESPPDVFKPLSLEPLMPRARGLANLGNTCFFNSVMQCLGQTPYLLELLEETSQPGQHFKLPGGKLVLDEKAKTSVEMDPLEGKLEEWRSLTKILAETLRELQSGVPEVYNPRMLHSQLTSKLPQFGDGDQHDSHELLRHMLEAVREEDLRRYQIVILESLGLSRKTNPTTVDGELKKKVVFYGSQASEMRLPTEQVFRGVLISTLQCQDCDHTSHRDDFFLDLSLPISEKQTPPILRRKADELDDNKPSKYQQKKERKQAKKNKRSKSHKMSISSPDTSTENQAGDNNSESESDADVEDNVEDSSNNARSGEECATKGTESGYNSDKNGGSQENNSPDMCVDDSGIPSPTVGMLNVSPLAPASPQSSVSSETNIDIGSPLCGRNTPNDEINEEFERPESRLSFVHTKNNDLKANLEKLSLETENKNNNLTNGLDGAYGGIEEDEKMEVEDSEDTWSSTISARYNIENGECSVLSCLNQFTTSELMTASNKVVCECCTKRYGGPNKKNVYTNARKQLLIYNPPAVLILHLKRFQVCHFRLAKISKNVKFPTLLDIAPFCSMRIRNLPTFEPNQTKVLYSLYGVVEHMGSMYGGHYVAYVKVRPKLASDSYRWRFLPKNQRQSEQQQQHRPLAEGDVEPPPGKWYYISDSHAAEVPEARVLNANAYLLFYERIL